MPTVAPTCPPDVMDVCQIRQDLFVICTISVFRIGIDFDVIGPFLAVLSMGIRGNFANEYNLNWSRLALLVPPIPIKLIHFDCFWTYPIS